MLIYFHKSGLDQNDCKASYYYGGTKKRLKYKKNLHINNGWVVVCFRYAMALKY